MQMEAAMVLKVIFIFLFNKIAKNYYNIFIFIAVMDGLLEAAKNIKWR